MIDTRRRRVGVAMMSQGILFLERYEDDPSFEGISEGYVEYPVGSLEVGSW